MSARVITIGAVCFGLVIGYVTYRTLARSEKASVSDIAAVIAAVGGGAVTALSIQTSRTHSAGMPWGCSSGWPATWSCR